jgi:hypothetical protein
MSLLELQEQILQAVLADEASPVPELLSDARADATSRLTIYRDGYRVRLRDALISEFPGLSKMMGRRFEGMLESYVGTHPSTHYNIRWHGAGLAAFLRYGLPRRESPELADMASLDWAISTAFDAADEPVLAAADLSDFPADAWANLRLLPQNNLQILALHYNVDAFRRAADHDDKRPRLRRYPKVRYFLIWRDALVVRYRPIVSDELSALHAAIKGESFATLCESLFEFHTPAEALPRMASVLHRWLADGILRGWTAH